MKTVFVTPSYRGDFERCKLLCESTTRFLADDIDHILIVDRRDIALFKALQNHKIKIFESESLMPWWIFNVPGISGWRASLKTYPIRNWIYQQILKLSASELTDAEIIQFVDSDVTLLRPFDAAYLTRGNLVRLQHTSHESPEHQRWLEIARTMFGVSPDVQLRGNYVGNFTTWRRSNVIAMKKFIENRTGGSWIKAIASQLRFSEYMMYGVFVDHVLGEARSGHFRDDSPNLALCWNYDVRTEAGMARFLADLKPEAFGMMIHSKYNIPVESYKSRVEEIWRKYD